jgi:diketogulonate reductase-like aldo/keto reductase
VDDGADPGRDRHRASRPEQVHANAKASGIELSPDTLAAIDEALGDTPIKQPTLAPLAQAGVKHR